jgi:hypothetical protein
MGQLQAIETVGKLRPTVTGGESHGKAKGSNPDDRRTGQSIGQNIIKYYLPAYHPVCFQHLFYISVAVAVIHLPKDRSTDFQSASGIDPATIPVEKLRESLDLFSLFSFS